MLVFRRRAVARGLLRFVRARDPFELGRGERAEGHGCRVMPPGVGPQLDPDAAWLKCMASAADRGANQLPRGRGLRYPITAALEDPQKMSATDQLNDSRVDGNNNEPRLVLDLDLIEAQALRAWLLETELNGTAATDTPVVNSALAKLARAVDTAQATVNIRREFQQAGVNLAHWSDEQVLELGRRIAEAVRPVLNI